MGDGGRDVVDGAVEVPTDNFKVSERAWEVVDGVVERVAEREPVETGGEIGMRGRSGLDCHGSAATV